MTEIKLQRRLPGLSGYEEQIVNEAIMEAYQKGQADAREDLCKGCAYKSYYAQIAAQGDCNDCGKARSCQHVPHPGSIVRINCPLWRAKG